MTFLQARRASGQAMPDDYERQFKQAEQTYQHQIVWDPVTKAVRPLCPYPPGLNAAKLPHAGTALDPATAAGVAAGRLNPVTLEQFPRPGGGSDGDAKDTADAAGVRDAITVSPLCTERYINNTVGRDPAAWDHRNNPARLQPFNKTETKADTMLRKYYSKWLVKENCRDPDRGGAAVVIGTPAGQIPCGTIHRGQTNGEARGLLPHHHARTPACHPAIMSSGCCAITPPPHPTAGLASNRS